MTTTSPDAGLALGRVSQLYQRNLAQLGRDDIIIASHGGSGQSLIGNILFELGLNYVDAYTEVLQNDGRAVTADRHTGYREHLAAQHDKDQAEDSRPVMLWPRFVKTHHPPVVFTRATFGGTWVLIRDPRDAIYASYQWRARFAEEPWDQVPGTFLDWLRGPGDFSRCPVDDWPAFYLAWAERARQCDRADVLRFEDLKHQPVEVVSNALRRLGIEMDRTEIERAVQASSFAKMRAHEDRITSTTAGKGAEARVMRAGKTEGWKDWMTPELAEFFSGAELRTVAGQYGYDLSASG